jgi:hypothetical protein
MMPQAQKAQTGGALALQHGLKLTTRDTRHLDPAVFPFVVVPHSVRASVFGASS